MTSRKISGYDALTSVQSDDLLVVVDVHDTSMASSGTTKKMTLAQAVTVAAPDYAPSGLTGATAASRYAGGTTSGAPASGTFALGDFVIDQAGKVWICTTAGSPGTWTAAGPTIPVTIAQGGTGQTTQQAALDALAAAQTSGQFLRGNGTHVVMSAIQAADLSLTFPWQFYVDNPAYGAKGDGKVAADVSTTVGSKVITSASAGFTAADVGKHVMINGGNGTAAGPYIDVIASVQSATQATLTTNNAGATATNCAMVWGTDDTAAINAAVSAAKTYALANNYFAEVVFGPRIYILSAAPVQTSGAGGVVNAQIPLPYPAVTGATQKLVIRFTGAGDGGFAQFFESATPNLTGTCIVSTQTAPSTPDPTFGFQSVIGGPSGGGAFTGGFANTQFVIDGICVYRPAYTNMMGYDFGFLAGVSWGRFSSNIFAPPVLGTQPRLTDLPAQVAFQSTISVGCRFPLVGNNDDVAGTRFCDEGSETGFWFADHFTAASVCTVYNDLCGLIDLTHSISGNSHAVTIGNWSAEAFNGALKSNGGGGSRCQVDIVLDTESTGGADPSYDVSDAGNTLYGEVRWGDPGRTNARPVISGASNLRVTNDRLGPGHWAGAPAAPSSTASQQNTAWRDAWITLSATTGITVITVDGTTTGLTAGNGVSVAIRVPSGKSYAVTYGGTLTATWWLD